MTSQQAKDFGLMVALSNRIYNGMHQDFPHVRFEKPRVTILNSPGGSVVAVSSPTSSSDASTTAIWMVIR